MIDTYAWDGTNDGSGPPPIGGMVADGLNENFVLATLMVVKGLTENNYQWDGALLLPPGSDAFAHVYYGTDLAAGETSFCNIQMTGYMLDLREFGLGC